MPKIYFYFTDLVPIPGVIFFEEGGGVDLVIKRLREFVPESAIKSDPFDCHRLCRKHPVLGWDPLDAKAKLVCDNVEIQYQIGTAVYASTVRQKLASSASKMVAPSTISRRQPSLPLPEGGLQEAITTSAALPTTALIGDEYEYDTLRRQFPDRNKLLTLVRFRELTVEELEGLISESNLDLLDRTAARRLHSTPQVSKCQWRDASETVLQMIGLDNFSAFMNVEKDVVCRASSSIDTADFEETFSFGVMRMIPDREKMLLSHWKRGSFQKFKEIVKRSLCSRMPKLLETANNPALLEAGMLHSILKEFLEELIPPAFEDVAETLLSVGPFRFQDGKIDTVQGKSLLTVSFYGITDLSCIVLPFLAPVCGCDTKVGTANLTKLGKAAVLLSDDGKRAMSQTGSQILGAAAKFSEIGVGCPVFSQIATNGWQFLLVKRFVKNDGCTRFIGYVPVSLAQEIQVNGQNKFVQKDLGDASFDAVTHMVAIMFDTARFLAHKLAEEGTMTSNCSYLPVDEKCVGSTPICCGSKHNKRIPLKDLDPNTSYYVPTVANLRHHNKIMNKRRQENAFDDGLY